MRVRCIFAGALLCLLTSGCASLRAPAIDHGVSPEDKPWQVHCETARKLDVDAGDAPAAQQTDWVFARDLEGQPYTVDGELVDGFFEVSAVRGQAPRSVQPTRLAVRRLCLEALIDIEIEEGIEDAEKLMLGWVMVARPGEQVNIPPVYPDELGGGNRVTRVVIFGDSLTDTGRLKQRLKIFPGKPYWIGRFSNGPVWPEYLGMATGMGIQSLAYGGASATKHDALPGASLYAQIRDLGQFFVSGSIELQIDDYIQQTLVDGHIERTDTTAFLIWGGANDYISKEPLSGLITTFLNSPEGESGYKTVAEDAVASLGRHVRTLYGAGARRFVLIDLPDLGHTPIVLQNTTYVPERLEMNDTARRIELARRLTQLSNYHNQLLDEVVEQLRAELTESEILLVDSFGYFRALYDGSGAGALPVDRGYDLVALAEILEDQDTKLGLQKPCYSGSYVGPIDEAEICPYPEQALFWDAVHPTTLTHCWHAWKVGTDMAAAGWIRPLPDPPAYLPWCQMVTARVTAQETGHFSALPKSSN